MRKQGHTPIPRYRTTTAPAVLAHGFRPFFLLAGIWAAVALALSIEMIQGRIELPTAFDPITWHLHEMLFGFVVATITGFVLTAIPNWTGRFPLQGISLAGLVLLWFAGRAAVATSGLIGAGLAAVIDVAFLLVLAGVTLREILAGRNWRNLPIVLAIILLLLSNALFHAEAAGFVELDGLARRFAIAVVIALITLVGGRIVPSFSRNWLVKRGVAKLPASFGVFDRLTLAATTVALGYWTAKPDGWLAGSLAGAAAILNLLRLARWCGHLTYPEPLLWILHVGYLWIPLGLALLALGQWSDALPSTAALHALTAGAMGTMTLAVMSRATLGHTGRALRAGAGLTASYLLIVLAALLRVSAPLWAEFYMSMLAAAAITWIAAFVIYLGVCGPMLVMRNPDRSKT